jgi:4-amino-4-deoxy-L-arabinose transferase-like glycosyltransferase
MNTDVRIEHRPWRFLLLALLIVAALTRLYHFGALILDQHHGKQVFIANKARNIARSPLSALWNSFDFLDAQGDRITRVEEVPLYAVLVGANYALLGEQEWLGRAWSILATLVAIVALNDLMRREYDEEVGLIACFVFAFSPLTIFYGRAVTPDSWMLACVLLCATSYRRYLDEGVHAQWVAAAGFGLVAAAFKYYGLMVLIPLADMAYRRGGWRSWFTPRFLVLASVMILPIVVWILGVFVRYPNPTSRNPYFFFQAPHLLLHRRFFLRLTLGLFVNDIGPVTTILIALGALGGALGTERVRPLLGWTVSGLLFVFLFTPKFLDHDYYGLLALPAAAGWGALGWRFVASVLRRRNGVRAWRVAVMAGLVAVIQSPLIMMGKFEMERHHAIVARRLDQLCTPSGKVIVLGQMMGWPVIHYCGRMGWVEECRTLPAQWEDTFRKHRALGAELVALYFDPSVPAEVRKTYQPLLETLPLLEHQSGPWFRRDLPCEYYILSLRDLGNGGASPAPIGPKGRVAASTHREAIR